MTPVARTWITLCDRRRVGRQQVSTDHPEQHPIGRAGADGAVDGPSSLPNRRLVDRIVPVDDAEIAAAMAWLWENLGVVAEPSGACAMAAVLARRPDPARLRVGVVVSGGNIASAQFRDIVARPGPAGRTSRTSSAPGG